ncbi:hypothetical protein OKW29_000113 [Paraburkholderia sp. CI3]
MKKSFVFAASLAIVNFFLFNAQAATAAVFHGRI